MFTLAIVGRPNVGKSTLFNRLTGTRHALVDDAPGTTRDWRVGNASLGGLEFRVIDTAGLERAEKDSLEARMMVKTEAALAEADAILLVVDARAGITALDKHFANIVRKQKIPVLLAVNKCEGGKVAGPALAEAHGLGLGEPVGISAEHGEGLAELYEALVELGIRGEALGSREEEEESDTLIPNAQSPAPIMQIAIIGRPNAGKSTLLNALIEEDRVLTGPEPGMTRDAIAVEYTYKGKALKLIDTAGMRRKSNITAKLEKLAVGDTLRAIQFAHVVVLVLDAHHPLEKQDNTIASLIEQEGRALVLALNKWDEVAEKDRAPLLKELQARLGDVMPQMGEIPIIPISALAKKNLHKLMGETFAVYERWNSRVSTGQLNRWLEKAIARNAPPLADKRPIKIRYITQTKSRPPHFFLFVNEIRKMPESYLRYLINNLRTHFHLPGVPIRLSLRKSKNPYSKEN